MPMTALHGLFDKQSWQVPSSATPTVLLSLFLILVTALLYRRLISLDLFKIPSPWGDLPIAGHVVQMALHVSNGHEQFLKWHEAYGRFVRIRILHRDIVLVADPKAAWELLAKGPNECPRRTPEYTTFNVVGFIKCTTSRSTLSTLSCCILHRS